MRVLVTGGTGFLGSNTVAALRAVGHDVRVLARSRERVAPALALHGLDASDVEVALGDMNDAGAVREAVAGCDSVVHAAAVYSLDPRDAEVMRTGNAAGTRTVITAALDAGVQRAVHVSSIVALMRTAKGSHISSTDGPGDLSTPYSRSKVESDLVVRELQAAGAPVVRFHPAGIIGPGDPYLNESNSAVRGILRGRPPIWPKGRFTYCDVRDCAATLVALVEGRGDGVDAWLPPITALQPGEQVDLLRRITGRALRTYVMDGMTLYRLMAPTAGVFRRLPASVEALAIEGVLTIGVDNVFDPEDSAVRIGIPLTPLEDTMRDTVRWLLAKGQITAKQAGRAAI